MAFRGHVVIKKFVHVIFSALVFSTSVSGAATQDASLLFKRIELGGDASPPEAYLQLWSVDVDDAYLREPAPVVTLNIPGLQDVQG